MFLLRRAAARAAHAAPSRLCLAQPRSFASLASPAHQKTARPWHVASLQKRFASDDAAKTESARTATPAAEDFAQTAAEAPIDDSLTPARQQAQAEFTDSRAAAGVDTLYAAANAADTSRTRSSAPQGHASNPPGHLLYVGNLYYEVSGDQLRKVFERFGDITRVEIAYDGRGLSRGFGFVRFDNIADAQAAKENLDQQIFEGRTMIIQYHRERPDQETTIHYVPAKPSRTLFVGNMSFEMSDKDLNDLFREVRNVKDVRVAIDRRTGQPRGFAHADFIDIASATEAKQLLEGKVIYGRKLRVDYSSNPSYKPNRWQSEST